MDPFLLIVGRGRSGTTLVRAMLDTHPEVAVANESHFLVGLGRSRSRYEQRDGFAVDALVSDLAGQMGFRRWGMTAEQARAALTPEPRTVPEAVRRLYAAYAGLRGKARYADKTPNYVMHLGLLASMLPEARFLHVIRDGRNSSLSYLDAAFGPSTLAEAAITWRRFVRAGRRAGEALGPERYLELRYEDLVEDPERSLRALCSFAGLAYDDAMLRYPDRAADLVGKIHTNLTKPPTKGMRDWRKRMTPADVALFDALAGDLLTELGYERGAARVPARIRLLAAAERARVAMLRARRRARKSAGMKAPAAASGEPAR